MEEIPEGAVISLRNASAQRFLAPASTGALDATVEDAEDGAASFRVSWLADPSGRWMTLTQVESGRRVELAPTDDGRAVELRAVVRPPGWRTTEWEKFRVLDGAYLFGKGAEAYVTRVVPSRAWWKILGGPREPPRFAALPHRTEGASFEVRFVSVPPRFERLPLPSGSVVALRDERTGLYLAPSAPGERPTWTLVAEVDDPRALFRLHKTLDARGELLSLESMPTGAPVVAFDVDGRKILAPALHAENWTADGGERMRRDEDGALFCVDHGGYFTAHAAGAGDEQEVTIATEKPARALRVVSAEAERVLARDRRESSATMGGVWASPSLSSMRDGRTRRVVVEAPAPAATPDSPRVG